jgi:Raf kinase inhibitor-like YbhB/YbcL family protein
MPTPAVAAATVVAFALTSLAFGAGQPIPSRFTCDGADVSPALRWSGAPAGTKSFALVVHDPDAPDPRAPRTDWVHWVVYDIPANVVSLPEGASGGRERGTTTGRTLPPGTREGEHDGGGAGWSGPCPPTGRHRYFFELYALDAALPDLGPRAARGDLQKAMQGHVLAHAQLMGTYEHGAR